MGEEGAQGTPDGREGGPGEETPAMGGACEDGGVGEGFYDHFTEKPFDIV